MPIYSYEDGKYILFYRDNGDVLATMDEVAISFSKDEDPSMWTLHKHGTPKAVQEWHDNTVMRFRKAGHYDIVNDMVMISGKFPVDELNKCIEISGYIKRMVEKLGLEV